MDDDSTFFERERDRLARDITTGFEELLSSTNGLNRKLEEVLGMTREYDTIATLWSSFYELMRQQREPEDNSVSDQTGMPGTGGHIVSQRK
ncbi:DASH complex subunit Dad1-domain-containing protein [Mycena floridula]|nr:DASH complex subunit Dad1-domain-containing protein [Mycena floridula]